MSLFVSGTDTGIGKTVVSTILALKLGYRYWKPIQSGLESPTDSEWVAARLGKDRIVPEAYRLTRPLSPHAAAKEDQVEIELERIIQAAPQGKTIIEGCGGLLVPLNSAHFIADLIAKLGAPTVLVARSRLGTINHTMLSLEAMRSRGLKTVGVVLVGERNRVNREAIERFGGFPVIGEIPFLEELDRASLVEMIDRLDLEAYETQGNVVTDHQRPGYSCALVE